MGIRGGGGGRGINKRRITVPKFFSKTILIFKWNALSNKKVLLRERKRHTARHVASARYAAVSNGWGVPHPDLIGG